MAQQTQAPQTQAEYEQFLRQQVQQGDPVACFKWVEYVEQQGVAPNQLEAQNRLYLLKEASNKGLGAASMLLANWYLNGHYVAKDSAQAILFLEHAATVGKESYGYYELARMFDLGLGVPQQPEKAKEFLQKAMDMGNPDAVFSYAVQKETNLDRRMQLLKENYKKRHHLQSLLWLNDSEDFDQAKVQSYFETQTQDAAIAGLLAFRYLNQQRLDEARHLADQSAEKNHPIGLHVRALVEQADPQGSADKVQHYLLQAARYGHTEAAYQAAVNFLQIVDHLTDAQQQQQLLQQVVPLLAQAAHANHAAAQYSLGQCLLQGIGVEANPQEGMAWIERAAQQGHTDAVFTLAVNLPVEHEQHLPLLQYAAQQGHTKAMLCVGIYWQKQQQPEQAIEWFELAQQRGDVRATFLLGLAYLEGFGVEADSKRAVELLNQAGEGGDAEAYFVLYESYRDGKGVRRNKKSQEKYLKLAQDAGFPEALSVTEQTAEEKAQPMEEEPAPKKAKRGKKSVAKKEE